MRSIIHFSLNHGIMATRVLRVEQKVKYEASTTRSSRELSGSAEQSSLGGWVFLAANRCKFKTVTGIMFH
jgi:hypothetical protein